MNIGVDIVHISRMKQKYDRYGIKFLQKFMTEQEIDYIKNYSDIPKYASKCWVVKEAAIKASNILNAKKFEYTKDGNIPKLKTDVSGNWILSISDEKDTVIAVVVRTNYD